MIVAAAAVPATPMLVRELSGTRPVFEELRAAAVAAVRDLIAARPDVVVVVGEAERDGTWPGTARLDVRRFAPPLAAGPGADPTLPTSLGVAAWLLDAAGWAGRVELTAVAASVPPVDAAALGTSLEKRADAVALVVAGDGSARRDVKAPGHLDARAAAYDDAVLAALTAPDPEALLALDPDLAQELMVTGRGPWQVLAGALRERPERNGRVSRLRHREDPLGVDLRVVSLDVEPSDGGS